MTAPDKAAANAIVALEKLLDTARDGALLRYSLGNEYLKQGEPQRAIAYLQSAVDKDPNYSAAWKLLGKAHSAVADPAAALAAYENGIRVASARGDVQAAKEMQVFVKRLRAAAK